ncbi:MAG: glycoside hydrolase family 32 protein, partial [Myxococcota bacterium]
MNDPNGLVYVEGLYHLFYQYNPNEPKWGSIHWGHATSRDLVSWHHHAPALYPDPEGLGHVASGSAVVDPMNTSGFAGPTPGPPPVVAMFSHFPPDGGQVQSLAFSRNGGATWQMFEGNPVLKRPDLADFRDPKVFWYPPHRVWVMVLAAGEQVIIYRSPNLRDWAESSRFGEGAGAHGFVWECPDLFPIGSRNSGLWCMLVSVQGGAPNGGSGTQYFLGHFDGEVFSARTDPNPRWIGWGPDDYAGVSWSNLGSRRVTVGWMSNHLYAHEVPTEGWR